MKDLLPWLNTVGWWKVSAGSHCTHVPFGEQTNDLRLIVQEDALSFLMTHGNHQLNLGLVLAFMCFPHTVVVNAGGDHREALKLDYFCMNTGQWFLNSAIPLVDRITTSTPLGAWYGHRGCTPPAPPPPPAMTLRPHCPTCISLRHCEETHRLRGSDSSHGWVDDLVLLDWSSCSLPANIEGVGSGVENLDVPHRTALHYQAKKKKKKKKRHLEEMVDG